jgi:hypothetical protein
MTSFLSFHAAAAARGDGLRPDLLALRIADPRSDLMRRHDGMIQSGPDPGEQTGDAPASITIASEESKVATASRNDSSACSRSGSRFDHQFPVCITA